MYLGTLYFLSLDLYTPAFKIFLYNHANTNFNFNRTFSLHYLLTRCWWFKTTLVLRILCYNDFGQQYCKSCVSSCLSLHLASSTYFFPEQQLYFCPPDEQRNFTWRSKVTHRWLSTSPSNLLLMNCRWCSWMKLMSIMAVAVTLSLCSHKYVSRLC